MKLLSMLVSVLLLGVPAAAYRAGVVQMYPRFANSAAETIKANLEVCPLSWLWDCC